MSAPVSEGDLVLDKYRVERVLGKGGMGVVVAATHVDLDQRVALKFLLPAALEHPDIVERFAREARAAAKIQSQHVARVIDTGRMPTGTPFMVMEYLEGLDLSDVLEKERQLAPAVAVDYVLQACEAIAEAHAAGIVHRDLKPSNLFLAKQRDRRAIIKVLDFGISKLEDSKVAPLTRTATMMGSPHYMSPEQLTSSKDVDARTDIWSLGVILYELVAGQRPFDAETMPEIVALILRNTPARLTVFCPEVTLDFELAVSRCLSTFAQDRFRSVAELAAALRPFAPDAASAGVSVGRITRILGGNSIPPATTETTPRGSGASRQGISVDETLPARDAVDTKLVVAAAEKSVTAAAPAAERSVTASAVATEKPITVAVSPAEDPIAESEAKSTNADAVTVDAVAIAPARSAPAGRRSKSLGFLAVGGAVLLGGAVYAAMRTTPAASAPSAGHFGVASASAVSVAASGTTAPNPVPGEGASVIVAPTAPAIEASAIPSLPAAAASGRPTTSPKIRPTPSGTAKATAATPTASSTGDPKKSPLNMGIK